MDSVFEQNRDSRLCLAMLSVFLVLTLLVSGMPQSQAAAVTCKFKHTVQPGETLIYLGFLYQVDWKEIAEANNIYEPYVITAGQVLCIPYGTEPVTTTTTKKGKEPSVTIIPSLRQLLVAVENFPKKMSYYLRLFPTGYATNSYYLGHFTTNKEGDYTGWFKIPINVPRTAEMRICIKNVWTDAVSCFTYIDPYMVPVYLYPKCNQPRDRR